MLTTQVGQSGSVMFLAQALIPFEGLVAKPAVYGSKDLKAGTPISNAADIDNFAGMAYQKSDVPLMYDNSSSVKAVRLIPLVLSTSAGYCCPRKIGFPIMPRIKS